jgi:tRNA pseudouridine55 synthase
MQAPRTRVQRRPVHGVLLLDKPLGLSSNQALQKAKWLLRAEKAGHTGTLDPLATGVLPLCFGAATKFSQIHLDADKTYEAVVRLGITTTTADAEGDVLSQSPVDVSLQQIESVAQLYTGPIEQVPPMYSALKKDGKALYEYARAGQEVERTARNVTIHSIEIIQDALESVAPTFTMRVACSKGTYIRTLAEDMGKALGCGAHLAGLRRIRTGDFDVSQCINLETLEDTPEAERVKLVRPVDVLLNKHTPVTLDSDNAARFLTGMRRRGSWQNASHVAVYASDQAFLGTAHITAGELIPNRLLSPLDISESRNQTTVIN